MEASVSPATNDAAVLRVSATKPLAERSTLCIARSGRAGARVA